MIVHSIALDFFRNYVHLDARFSPEVNVIYGENAQGKHPYFPVSAPSTGK